MAAELDFVRNLRPGIAFALQPMVPAGLAAQGRLATTDTEYRGEVLARPQLRDGQTLEDWFSRSRSKGLLPELDLALLRQLSGYATDVDPTVGLSVNIFPESLECPLNFDEMIEVLGQLRPSTEQVCIEITEHSAFRSPSTVHAKLKLLRARGFHVALDDFGVGSNHILLIASGAVTEIKLDRHWLAEEISQRQLCAMVAFAHSLGLAVVAEGIDTSDRLTRACDAGCDFVQGFHVARPRLIEPRCATA